MGTQLPFLFSTTMSVMLRTLFLVLAVGAVLSHAQPASPRLPSTWSSYVTFNSESLSLLYGAIYMDYTTNNQRADLVSLVAAQNTFFQTFDSSGTFTSETLVYTAASSGNVPGCVSYPPPSGKVIPQDLSAATFVGAADWYGTPAYLWSFKDNGDSFSIYTDIKTSGLLALESFNDTTNAVDSFVTFTGFSDALPQGAFTVPTPLCKSPQVAADAAAPEAAAHRNALFSLINRFANALSNE